MKKILNAIIDVLIVIVLVFSLLVVSLSLTTKNNGVPSVFGYTIFTVQTDSMEPTINVGDLVVSKITKSDQEFNVGDVVTFRAYQENISYLNTHRIVSVKEVGTAKYYTTKGDNSIGQDSQEMVAGDIVAIWNGVRIPKVGTAIDWLQTQKGFFIAIVLPMIVFFIYTLYRFVISLVEYNKEKAVNAAKEVKVELTEEAKKQAIEEYLKQQEELKNKE